MINFSDNLIMEEFEANLKFETFTLSKNKEFCASLKAIKGIGWRKARYITSRVGLCYPFNIDISLYHFKLITYLLKLVTDAENYNRRIGFNITKMIDIGIVKGVRHKLSLPVHGQRTRTNAGTQRSKRIRDHFKKLEKKR